MLWSRIYEALILMIFQSSKFGNKWLKTHLLSKHIFTVHVSPKKYKNFVIKNNLHIKKLFYYYKN